MAKATFDDFIKQNPMCQNLNGNKDARKIFDILNKDENIYNAIKISAIGKPALEANVNEIENYIDKAGENNTFDLKVDINRMNVGKMQKTILAPFGYINIQNSTKQFKSKYFTSASCYEKTGTPTMFVKVVVGEI